jgi:hypothetical protein
MCDVRPWVPSSAVSRRRRRSILDSWNSNGPPVLLFFKAVPGVEPRAMYILGKHSGPEPQPALS